MSTKAHVEHDPMSFGVRIAVAETHDGRVTHLTTWEPPVVQAVDDDGRASLDIEGMWLRLPDDVARALLDALASHYGGTSDVQTLRRDYEAERKRVDTFIAHLTSGATR